MPNMGVTYSNDTQENWLEEGVLSCLAAAATEIKEHFLKFILEWTQKACSINERRLKDIAHKNEFALDMSLLRTWNSHS